MKNENMENTPEFETEYDTLDPISAARNGKIAALSRDIRESLNRRIRRAQPGPDVLEWLNAEPSVVEVLAKRFDGKPVTRQNLWEWRHGGYKQWARHRAACHRLNHKQKGKRVDRHQLGDEMAQLYAEELTVTLDELIDFAPDSEVRMQRLEKGLNQIRGWRRSDYHAQRMALQIERMALDREKLQWRSECQKQDRELKEQKLKLDRAKYTRDTAEWVVKVFTNPNIKSLARDETKTYAENIANVNVAMFGPDGDELDKDLDSLSTPESGVQSHPKAEGGMQNAESGKGEAEKGAGDNNIEHPTPNIKHPVEGAKGEEEKGREGDESVPQADGGKTLQNGQNDAVQDPAPSPSVVPGRPENETKKNSAGETPALPGSKNLQPSTCNMQPSIDGPMTLKQAEKVVDEWYQKARRLGGIVVNSWDVADLRAYLSQQPAPYYSLKTYKDEFRQPPSRDPRYDPASPWSRAWPYLEAEMRANEKK